MIHRHLQPPVSPQLYGKVVPNTVQNFVALVTGKNEKGVSYEGTEAYRVLDGLNIQVRGVTAGRDGEGTERGGGGGGGSKEGNGEGEEWRGEERAAEGVLVSWLGSHHEIVMHVDP